MPFLLFNVFNLPRTVSSPANKRRITKVKINQIFWDNDGVLVDTERYYFQASQETLALIGIDLSVEQFTELSLTEGKSLFDLATENGIALDTIEELKGRRDNRYAELLEEKDMTLPGVKEVLHRLHGKISMAIVTSSQKSHFDIIHKQTELLPFFDFCLTREDYINSKPSPEPYLLALQKSGVKRQQSLVIEDSQRGLTAAKEAGINCWILPNSHTSLQNFSQADKILLSIWDLPELLL